MDFLCVACVIIFGGNETLLYIMKKLNGCRVAWRFFAVRTVRLDRAPLASIFDQIVSRRAKLIHHGRVAVVLFS